MNMKSAMKSGFIIGILAMTLLSTGCSSEVDKIIDNKTKVLKQDPNNVTALIDRGTAFNKKEEFQKALVDHNKAIELAPESARARLARGNTYIKTEEYEKALSDFEKSISLNPDIAEAYARRGQANVLLQTKFEEAIKDLNKSIELGFNDAEAYQYRGLAQFKLGQTNSATQDYLKANALAPSKTEILTEAIKLGLNDKTIYLRRGEAYKLNRSYASAISDFTEVIKRDPQLSEAYEERADAYFSKGDCSEAQDDLQRACKVEDRKMCSAISLSCSAEVTSGTDIGTDL